MSQLDGLPFPPKYRIPALVTVASVLLAIVFSCCGGFVLLVLQRVRDNVAVAAPDVPEEGPQGGLTDEELKPWKEAIRVLEDMERKVAEADPQNPQELLANSMKSGDLGVIKQPIRVVQVLESDEVGSFLATIGRSSLVVKITQVDTRDIVDDRLWISGDTWFYVAGPTQYTTVTGAQKTVLWLMKAEPPKSKAPSDPT